MTSSLPSISVVIPALNEAEHLRQALDSIGDPQAECIVVDGGSRDATCEIAGEYPGVKLLRSEQSGRGKQMNLGTAQVSGEIILFLHADCRLPEAAIEDVRRVCADNAVAGGSFCLGFARRHWVLRLCSLGSRINHPWTTYGDQAQFVRRDIFQRIGGFKEWPLMEDLEVQYRLRRHGRLIKIRRPVISSDRRYRRRGPFLHQLFNVLLVLLYLIGVSPQRLAGWYRPKR